MRQRLVYVAVVVAGIALGILGYHFLTHDHHSPWWQAVPSVAIAWAALGAGLLTRMRRPDSGLGSLMIWLGFALLVRKLQYSGSTPLFTLGFAFGQLYVPAFAHAVLAYPDGRLDRIERRVVSVAYVVAVALPVGMLLVWDPALSCLYNCSRLDRVRPESLLLVAGDKDAFRALQIAFGVAIYGLLAVAFVGLIVRKLLLATPRARSLYAPLVIVGVLAGIRAVLELVFAFAPRGRVTGNVLFGFEEVVQMAVPISLTYGLLRSQLARGHVASLVRELERTEPMGVEASIQRALHDRSLRVAFWVPERGAYVDAAGAPYALPSAGSRRAVTELEQKGEPIAALVYDPALRDDPELVESVCAAARLALGNARLHAELRAQLVKVRESRARIVAAGDAERLRIERDLHDGAQQRLVSVALDLRVAQRRLAEAGPEIAKVLGDAVENLQAAIEELRELARGVYPPILTEEGLAAALRSLGDRAPLPVSVDAGPDRGLSPEIASAAYFVACEALTNAVKHASPSRVTISAAQENGSLVLAIEDDGLGGADARKGTGLRGLADRVESYGGRLRIETRPGDGTRIIAELPCAS